MRKEPDNLRLLGNRAFICLWGGQTTSVFGDNLQGIALMWLVLRLTGSTLKMATVMLCKAVPSLILGPVSGAYVDRWDRRKTMITVDIARAVWVGMVPTLLTLGHLRFWHICLLEAMIAVSGTFFGPALSASMPMIVEEKFLMRANSLLESSSSVASIIGLAAGGVIVSFIGIAGAIYIDTTSFVVSALAILLISIPRPRSLPPEKHSLYTDLREGFHFVWTERVFLWLLCFSACINFALNPIGVLTPVFSRDVLHAGVQGYGFIMALFTVGGLIGAVLLSAVGDIKRGGLLVLGLLFGIGSFYLLFALSPSLVFALVAAVAVGVTINMAGLSIRTLLQRKVPNEVQGRVFSLVMSISSGLTPFATAINGVLGELVSVRRIFLANSGLILGVAVIAYVTSDVKRLA